MDPLSVTASVLALATAAQQTGKYLKDLHSMMGQLPGRLHTLNNEIADLELILQSVADLIRQTELPLSAGLGEAQTDAAPASGFVGSANEKSKGDDGNTDNVSFADSAKPERPTEDLTAKHLTTEKETDPSYNLEDVAGIVSRAKGYLDELRTLVTEIQQAGGNSKTARLSRVRRFRKELPRLNGIQENITHVKANLNILLGAANTRQMQRMHLELIDVSTTFLTEDFLEHSLVARRQDDTLNKIVEYLERVHTRVDRVETMLAQQHERYEQSQVALLGPSPPYSKHPPPLHSSSASSQFAHVDDLPSSAPSGQLQAVNFRVANRNRTCQSGCRCACHRPSRKNTPSIVDRIFGQLFVGYAGIPVVTPKCDDTECRNRQQPQIQAEYWFPAGVFWSQILRFQATFNANTGPQFQLKTLRRVPDSAEAVTFAMKGDIEGLKSLFRRGLASPVDVSDTRGYSLLRWALYSNQYRTCQYLVYAGADPDYRPKALTDNSPRNKASDIILQGGLSRETVEALSCMTSDSEWIEEQNFPRIHKLVTGLMIGDLAEELTKHPEAVNAQDAMGRTPLLWAAARGDEDAVVTLLNFGADPNIIDVQWSGPVAYSADRNHTACTRILLEAGAETDVKLPPGYKIGSPLNCAARNASDPLLIKTLLDFGAKVDACGVDGRTALIHAARINRPDFALLLLEHNADINAVSTAGHTPLTTAIMCNSHEVLKLLLDRWQDYNDCPRLKGPHLLKITAQYADLETVMILSTTNHFKLKYDMNYSTGDFETLLGERHDADEKLVKAFSDFLSIIREQLSDETLMEGGMRFRTPSPACSAGYDTESVATDEFEDALMDLKLDDAGSGSQSAVKINPHTGKGLI
ncbi:ankyrin repeat-containing domain protein [Hypoxylon trugodes]|uniref:ankyrin repeat-containing domain protein n=1 Tax=Hypoxylon trugodes TaxID=326681 RepID=UPI00219E9C83|nr:ankyrin repeat-containing domain protein [Hypoxylon trugodes]KAI1386841.1 ankyrin repeat-containing domain protein [Hypoxylon trugodes]